jgi:hypothetical protein
MNSFCLDLMVLGIDTSWFLIMGWSFWLLAHVSITWVYHLGVSFLFHFLSLKNNKCHSFFKNPQALCEHRVQTPGCC